MNDTTKTTIPDDIYVVCDYLHSAQLLIMEIEKRFDSMNLDGKNFDDVAEIQKNIFALRTMIKTADKKLQSDIINKYDSLHADL